MQICSLSDAMKQLNGVENESTCTKHEWCTLSNGYNEKRIQMSTLEILMVISWIKLYSSGYFPRTNGRRDAYLIYED